MKNILAATILSSVLVVPAFAMSDGMTCSDYTAMDTSAQAQALTKMQSGMSSGSSSSSGSMSSGESGSSGSSDTMSSGSSNSASSNGSGSSSGSMSSDDSTGSTSSGSADSEMMAEKVATACEGNPDMMVKDAMKKAMSK